jgi:hypothetical protein
MVRFIYPYVGDTSLVAAAIGELIAPAGKNEKDAVYRMTEYLLSDAGRQHFYDLHIGATEQDYHEALYQLYDMEEKEDFEAFSSGVNEPECNQCSLVGNQV